MSTQMPYTPDENERAVLDALREEGRANPMRIRDRTGLRKQYVNDALRQLQKVDVVRKVNRGLYEYAPEEDDLPGAPERDGKSDLRARLQNALEARDDQQARAGRLADDLEDCQGQLEQARETSGGVPDRAIRSLRAARTALDGQCPDVEMATTEIEAVLEALDDE